MAVFSSSRRCPAHGIWGFTFSSLDSFLALPNFSQDHITAWTGIGRSWHNNYVQADIPVYWTENEADFNRTFLFLLGSKFASRCRERRESLAHGSAVYSAHGYPCHWYSDDGFGSEAVWSLTRRRRQNGLFHLTTSLYGFFFFHFGSSTTSFHWPVDATRNLYGTWTRTRLLPPGHSSYWPERVSHNSTPLDASRAPARGFMPLLDRSSVMIPGVSCTGFLRMDGSQVGEKKSRREGVVYGLAAGPFFLLYGIFVVGQHAEPYASLHFPFSFLVLIFGSWMRRCNSPGSATFGSSLVLRLRHRAREKER